MMRRSEVGTGTASTARRVWQLTVLATASTAILAITLFVTMTGNGHGIAALVHPGGDGPAAAVIHRDFPGYQLPHNEGHDGQQFYAIARQPMHLRAAASSLDRPRYRFQRILLPVLAWALHPAGGGPGLVLAVFLVAVLGAVLLGVGGALVLDALGASTDLSNRAALILPVTPGAIASLAIPTSDALALGLVLLAFVLDLRSRRIAAILLAVLAVLARETTLLVLVGWVCWRGRRSISMVVVPAAVGFGWWLVLRVALSNTSYASQEFQPVVGFVRSLRYWIDTGHDLPAAVVVLASVALGLVALARRGLRSPLGVAIAIQLALVPLLSPDVLALNFNAPRALLALPTLAIVALAAPKLADRRPAMS